MSHAIGDAFAEACIDIMSEDLEMDAEDIATELEACGYEPEEAEKLSRRPWATTPSALALKCTERPQDQLLCEVHNEEEICISALHRDGDTVEEAFVYLNRAGAEQIHSWLGEWLAR